MTILLDVLCSIVGFFVRLCESILNHPIAWLLLIVAFAQMPCWLCWQGTWFQVTLGLIILLGAYEINRHRMKIHSIKSQNWENMYFLNEDGGYGATKSYININKIYYFVIAVSVAIAIYCMADIFQFADYYRDHNAIRAFVPFFVFFMLMQSMSLFLIKTRMNILGYPSINAGYGGKVITERNQRLDAFLAKSYSQKNLDANFEGKKGIKTQENIQKCIKKEM